MYVDTNNTIMAKIATNKSLLKEFETNDGRTVYLKDGDEFQIQLYNPTDEEIAATIYIDGKALSNQLILRPAERIWLERYLDTPRKFKFNTYEVEDNVETEKAISHNGEIKVMFYKKSTTVKIKACTSPYYYSDLLSANINTTARPKTLFNSTCTGSTITSSDSVVYSNSTSTVTDAIQTLACDIADYGTCAANSASLKNISTDVDLSFATTACAAEVSNTIETGRTGKGSYSSQTFEDVDMDFNLLAFHTEIIKILPISRKPYTANDLEKIYCTECGRKLKTKYKFCPFCGTKIDY